MSIIFRRTLDGSAPVTADLTVDQVDILAGEIVFWSTSGYVTSAVNGSAMTHLLAGVSEKAITGSGVTAGVTTIPVQVNRNAVYGFDSAAAITQTSVGINIGRAETIRCDTLDEATERTDARGIARTIRLLTTSGTSQVAECVLNFAAPTHE